MIGRNFQCFSCNKETTSEWKALFLYFIVTSKSTYNLLIHKLMFHVKTVTLNLRKSNRNLLNEGYRASILVLMFLVITFLSV